MNAAEIFAHWRAIKRPEQSWGLAWFLANEFCKRYYASHGIAPVVIDQDGLGYYGIQLNSIRCAVNQDDDRPHGRMTIGGDVENWRRGSPGDHGLRTMEMCANGVPTDEIVHRAIAHMNIELTPSKSHVACRHKRWGSSYELSYEIATICALRNEPEDLQIWNHPIHTKRVVEELDPKATMSEHLGAFLFTRGDRRLLLAADGRLLDGSGGNFWHEYMRGRPVSDLASSIEGRLNA